MRYNTAGPAWGAIAATPTGAGASTSMDPNAPPAVTEALRALPDAAIPVGTLSRLLGSRAHGLALVFLALPDALPIPIPSLSVVLGLPLTLISLHLLVYGESGALPGWLGRRQVPASLVRFLKTRAVGILSFGERFSRPRWRPIARRERMVGFASLLLSLLLLLPVPLLNTPPSLCLLLLGWGLTRKDGAIVAAGFAATVVLLGLVAVAAIESWQLLVALAA